MSEQSVQTKVGASEVPIGPAVPLSQFLANLARIPEAQHSPILWEDQRLRWQGGEHLSVEMYMQDLPPSATDDAILDLIYGEFVLRQEAGQMPRLEEYVQRFPKQAKQIRRLLSLHTGLAESGEIASTRSVEDGIQSGPARMPVECPKEIAGYRVIAPLDVGGQGMVYRGVHPVLGRDVVIKLGRSKLKANRTADLLFQEGRILAEMDHPGLAKIYDLKVHDDKPCLVMEFIRGRHLEQDARDRKRTPRESALLVASLARALAEVHRRGVVHGDIKPKNILIDETGKPRIVDFGLARVEDIWRQPEDDTGLRGTVSFMAPEQTQGKPPTPRTDVFALGGILYFLLVGRAPFAGTSFGEMRERAQNCDWDRTPLRERKVPARLRAVLEKALAPDQNHRQASADELADELERAVRPAVSRPWAWVGAAAAAVLVGVAAIFWSGQGDPGKNDNLDPKLTNGGPGPKKDPLPFSLHISVNKKRFDLLARLPLKKDDGLRIEARAPASMYASLFLVGDKGTIRLLASKNADDKEVPFSYPEKPNTQVALVGPGSNEFILLCCRRSTRSRKRRSAACSSTWEVGPCCLTTACWSFPPRASNFCKRAAAWATKNLASMIRRKPSARNLRPCGNSSRIASIISKA